MSRKLTYEEVKYFIEVESNSGCRLISKDYKSNQEKMQFECKCGNAFETTWNTFKTKNKRQCNDCGYKKTKKSRRLPYSEVKSEFEKRGYELVSKKYNNSHENLDFICNKHKQQGVQDINLDNLRYGHGCRFCSGYECINDYKKIDDFYILNIVSNNYNVDILIDREDVNKVKKYKWYFNQNSGYVQSHSVKGKRGYLHTFIMESPKGKTTDHINRNKLDNRKVNLRICTYTENAQNRDIPKHNTSGILGVNWHKKSGKWRAFITVDKAFKDLGRFNNVEDAIKTRHEAEMLYFGKYSPNYKSWQLAD